MVELKEIIDMARDKVNNAKNYVFSEDGDTADKISKTGEGVAEISKKTSEKMKVLKKGAEKASGQFEKAAEYMDELGTDEASQAADGLRKAAETAKDLTNGSDGVITVAETAQATAKFASGAKALNLTPATYIAKEAGSAAVSATANEAKEIAVMVATGPESVKVLNDTLNDAILTAEKAGLSS